MKIQLGRASAGHTLLRYFLSYFLVVGILLLGFVLLAYNFLASAVSERIYAQTEQRLDYVAERLEAELRSVFEMNAALTENIDIVLSRYDDSAYSQFVANRRLNDFAEINPFIEAAVYYDRANGRVLCTRRHVECEDGVFSIFSGDTRLDFELRKYQDARMQQLVYVENGEAAYLIYCPVVAEGAGYDVFYILNRLELASLLDSALSDDVVYVAFLDETGRVVAESGRMGDEQGRDESVSRDFTVLNPFTIAARISSDSMMAQLSEVLQRAYYAIIAFSALALLLVLLAMRSTYMPLRKLTQKFVKEPQTEQGYIEQLDRVFSHTVSENRSLQSKISQYRISMQKSVLDALISSGSEGGERDFGNIEPFFTMEPDNRIFVVCMRCKGEAFPAQEVAEIIRTSLPEGDACAILEAQEEGAAFVFNYSGPEQPKETVIQQLLLDMYREKGYLAALSNGSASPLDVPALYENAQRASQFWAQEPVVLYDAVQENLPSRAAAYPHEHIDALAARLGENDFAAARAETRLLFQLLDEEVYERPEMRSFFVRSILIDILATLVSAMNQAHIKFKGYSDLYFETLYFCRSFPYEQKEAEIQEHVGRLLDVFEESMANKCISAPQILRVVQEHCFSPDFSIALLADYFQVSIAYMSLQFKKEMGENFLDYVWKLRLEKAKQLLRESGLSIDEISAAVGYANASSFRRKFKQETGRPPSQLRSGGEAP